MAERKTPAELRVAIVFLRAVRGWDQAELAAAAGISKSSVYRYESGEASPSPKTFQRIVEAVGVPPPTMERLFAVIRSARAAVLRPVSGWPEPPIQDADSIAAEVSDEIFDIVRSTAALLLKGIEEEYGPREEADEGALLEP